MSVNFSELRFYKKLAEKLANKSNKPLSETSLAESRAAIENGFLPVNQVAVPYVDETVIARDGYPIPIRIYNHHLPAETPVLIYLMGNGYIYDLYKANTLICSRIADYAAIKTVIVNARLAPENPLPTSIYDAYDAIKSIASRSAQIMIFGYCTGAASAVVIADQAHRNKDFKIDQLILLNGLYDLTYSNNEFSAYENKDVSIGREMFDYIIRQQNISDSDKSNPLYSPLFNDNYTHFPPVTLIVAECDRNRSSSEAYYNKLNSHGVVIDKIVLKGQTHNTIIFHDQIENSEDPALVIAQSLKIDNF